MTVADTQISKVTKTVNSKLALVMDWARRAQTAAEKTVGAIGVFDTPSVTMNLPTGATIDKPEKPDSSGIPTTGELSNAPATTDYVGTSSLSYEEPIEITKPIYGRAVAPDARPTAAPPTANLNYPMARTPSAPTLPTFNAPTLPTLTEITKPSLVPINIPAYTFGAIQPFAEQVPDYTLPTIDLNPTVRLCEYSPDDLLDRVAALSMETIPPYFEDVCHFMAEEMVNNLDKEAAKATDVAFTQWAGQNFSLPPGMLVDQVNEIQGGVGAKIRAEKAKLNNEVFKTAFENYKAAMQQGIAMEKHYIAIAIEGARQLIEIERVKVKAQIALFNATVELFNAQQRARAIYANALMAEVQASIKEVEMYKVQVEGAIAKTAENEVRVGMLDADATMQKARAAIYKSSVKAALKDIEIYRAKMSYHKATADIDAANIASYREAVKGYSTFVSATAEDVGAYASQVQAYSSMANVDESNARAYAQYMQAHASRSATNRTFVNGQVDVMHSNMAAYKEAAGANESFVRAVAATISAKAELSSSRAAAYSSSVRAYSSYNHALAARDGALQHYNLAMAENAARAQSLAATAVAETDKVNAGARAARAQAIAGLAQGAMSAMHVSAAAQGSGGTSYGAKFSHDVTSQWGGQTNKSETNREVMSVRK